MNAVPLTSSSCGNQVLLITALQQQCEAPEGPGAMLLPVAGNLLKWLYDNDVVAEEAVLSWAGVSGSAGERRATASVYYPRDE